jgi:hypothetical protein
MRPGFGRKFAYGAMSFFDEVSDTERCGRMQTLRYDWPASITRICSTGSSVAVIDVSAEVI